MLTEPINHGKTEEEIKSFYNGMRYGVWLYAWWRNGEQRVGCGNLTLQEALKDVDKRETAALERLNDKKYFR